MLKPYVFLRGLLLLAGDVERNPGPIQGRQRAASCQLDMQGAHTMAVLVGVDVYMPYTILLESTR